MATEWIPGVTAIEIFGTRQENDGINTGQVPTASVQLSIASSDYTAARDALLGGPAEWPFPNITTLHAQSLSRSNEIGNYTGDDKNQITTDRCVITVQYAARIGGFFQPPDAEFEYTLYVEDSQEPRYESRPMNHRLFQWHTADPTTGNGAKSPLSPNETPVKTLSGFTLIHKVSGWFSIPDDIYDYQGTVASNSYVSGNLGRAFTPFIQLGGSGSYVDGVLMLRTVQVVQEFTHNSYLGSSSTYTIIFRYEYKADGWNRFWRPLSTSEGMYDRIEYKNNGTEMRPFPLRDHSKWLF